MKDLILIDYETTGFAIGTDHEVIEIGAVRLNDRLEEIASFTSVIRAHRLWTASPRAMEVHGISEAEILAAPLASEVWQGYVDAMGLKGDPDVYYFAHNAQFDSRCHAVLRAEAGAGVGSEYIHCTSRGEIFRHIAQAMGKRGMISLKNVAQHLGVSDRVDHRGLADVRLLADCMRTVGDGARTRYFEGVLRREMERGLGRRR